MGEIRYLYTQVWHRTNYAWFNTYRKQYVPHNQLALLNIKEGDATQLHASWSDFISPSWKRTSVTTWARQTRRSMTSRWAVTRRAASSRYTWRLTGPNRSRRVSNEHGYIIVHVNTQIAYNIWLKNAILCSVHVFRARLHTAE